MANSGEETEQDVEVEFKQVRGVFNLYRDILVERAALQRKLKLISEVISLGNKRLARALLKKFKADLLTGIIEFFKGGKTRYGFSEKFLSLLAKWERDVMNGMVDEVFTEVEDFDPVKFEMFSEGVEMVDEAVVLPESEYLDALDYVEKIFSYIQEKRSSGDVNEEVSRNFIEMKRRLKEGKYKEVWDLGERIAELLLLPREQFKLKLELKTEKLERIIQQIENHREIFHEGDVDIDSLKEELIQIKKAISNGFLLKSDIKIKDLSSKLEPLKAKLLDKVVGKVVEDADKLLKEEARKRDVSFERYLMRFVKRLMEERRYREALYLASRVRALLSGRGRNQERAELEKKIDEYNELVSALIVPDSVKTLFRNHLDEAKMLLDSGIYERARMRLQAFEKMLFELTG